MFLRPTAATCSQASGTKAWQLAIDCASKIQFACCGPTDSTIEEDQAEGELRQKLCG